MKKVLVVYSSRTGETQKIAELIAEGLRISMVETQVKKVTDIKKETDLDGFDGYLFGAPTYHGEMVDQMKTFLFLAEKANLAGKIGGAFGAFGWSGEAPERIFNTMKNVFQMEMVNQPLMLKSSSLGGGIQMAQEYGKTIAKKLNG